MRMEYEKMREIERRMKGGELPIYEVSTGQDWSSHVSATSTSEARQHTHANTSIIPRESRERSDSGYGSGEGSKHGGLGILHTRQITNTPSNHERAVGRA